MADLGQFNRLRATRRQDIGLFLDGAELGEILLPRRYLDDSMQAGDWLEVFLYRDSEDRVVATTETPRVQVGECAYLKVIGLNQFGAFLDWGLPKDLLVPFSEQQKKMQKGYSYAVYVYIDEPTQRIVASSRLERHLASENCEYGPRDPVDLLIYGRSDLGFKAIVNHRCLGQLYDNETFRRLHFGERLPGFVKQVRPDGKIDLSLQLPGRKAQNQLRDAILSHLEQHEGVSTLTDFSPPDEIYQAYGVSKAKYKKALGNLYREGRIVIEKHQITLNQSPTDGANSS